MPGTDALSTPPPPCPSPPPSSPFALPAPQVEPKGGRLGFVAGLIPQDKLNGFERLLFRATRGNMFLRQAAVGAVKDPASGEQVEKHVFVVFYAGERARTKILKVGGLCGWVRVGGWAGQGCVGWVGGVGWVGWVGGWAGGRGWVGGCVSGWGSRFEAMHCMCVVWLWVWV